MTHETMTVHKALAELKIIDDRISNAINNVFFVTAVKNGTKKINGVDINSYNESVRSSYQKANDLINRRNALKRAVVMSNATTKVVVAGVEYTVAEAIDMKNHGLDGMRMMLNTMARQYRDATYNFNKNSGEALEMKANEYVMSILGSQGNTADKTDVKQVQALHDSYVANNEFVMVDPIEVEKKIEDMRNKIVEFETEVDAALSVSNAVTTIDIEY